VIIFLFWVSLLEPAQNNDFKEKMKTICSSNNEVNIFALTARMAYQVKHVDDVGNMLTNGLSGYGLVPCMS